MQETLKSFWKTKVDLNDYNAKSDIELRLLLNSLSKDEVSLLEEILYSPLQVSIEELGENLEFSFDQLYPMIEKLQKTGLFTFDGTVLFIHKELRKYFEVQIEKFGDDFKPGMDFLQNILKQVPIHVLPVWYHIPRSSNNIFASLVEKYLITPQVYQRYITEFLSGDQDIQKIGRELFQSEELKLSAEEVRKKYHLSETELEEILINLEYNLICCSNYEPCGDRWKQVITPFIEWANHLELVKSSTPHSIKNSDEIKRFRAEEYAFIHDMTTLLKESMISPIEMRYDSKAEKWMISLHSLEKIVTSLGLKENEESYAHKLAEKVLVLGLGYMEGSSLQPSESAKEWMHMPIEKRSHVTFKHPHNFLAIQKVSPLATQRAIVEIQKSLSQVNGLGWVYFDDYFEKSMIVLSDEKKVALSKIGRYWQYALPSYSKEEIAFVEMTVLSWLFESGITMIGYHNGKKCFSLTTLGSSLLI